MVYWRYKMHNRTGSLALKIIENEINFLNRVIESKDLRIEELEHELARYKTKMNYTTEEYVGYNIED